MGFWIFMTLCALLIPATMIGIGCRFARKVPEQINAVFGYRTSRSVKNRHTWEFAHAYCGKLWRVLGWIMALLSVVIMALVFGKQGETVGTVGGGLVFVQVAVMLLSIIPVELALKKNFDQYGRKRHKEN